MPNVTCSVGQMTVRFSLASDCNIKILHHADIGWRKKLFCIPSSPAEDQHHTNQWGEQHAINGLTGRLALAFSFKEPPAGIVSNIVSESVFFTKLLMHEWPGKTEGETSKVLLKCGGFCRTTTKRFHLNPDWYTATICQNVFGIFCPDRSIERADTCRASQGDYTLSLRTLRELYSAVRGGRAPPLSQLCLPMHGSCLAC